MRVRWREPMRVSAGACGLLVVSLLSTVTVTAQQESPKLPELLSYDVPQYPPLARMARITGDVDVEVITDGYGVTSATVVVAQHALLKDAAVENAKTWRF